MATEKVFAAVCVSFQFQCFDWKGTCDHMITNSVAEDRSDTNNQDTITEERGPLTARVEHISPIGSLFVKLSPPIIQI